MTKSSIEPFGNGAPWSEPAWYNALESPYYNDSHRRLRKFVRDYVEENILPFEEEWEEAGGVPPEETVKYARAGFTFQDMPREYRGDLPLPAGIPDEEWDIFHFMVMSDELCRVNVGVSSGLSGGSIIGAPPIVRFGTEEQKRKWLPGIFTGEVRHCLGVTEPTGGSDVANLKTIATKTADGKYYIVNGHKKWITSCMHATHMTTAVRTGGPGSKGVSVLVIPTDAPGFRRRIIKNSGVEASLSTWVDLENVKVPVENLIGVENNGFPTLMSNFNKERFLMAIGMNRRARTCLAVALDYAHNRITFGKPLITHQIIKHKFATMARYIESHWALLEQIAYHIKIHGFVDELASRIALSKVHAGRILEMSNREAQQVMGGAGYQRGGVGTQVEQISRDLRMLVVGGGSEEIIADLAVRQELANAAKKGVKL
ncbi:hypothetical protein AJ80_07526 [Polytolypa hystricis UAMH7299]|uniref:Acyl-CoA dehydrogenase n=1 Tax=Polytolypa hystricis (strain UAMH7299) TaxID=1447883 RepID=A0A2B7XNW0_POLH7|nr:hypothetical protein AJ80_07526 [Polytolypa hystricis UAMH7299]